MTISTTVTNEDIYGLDNLHRFHLTFPRRSLIRRCMNHWPRYNHDASTIDGVL